MLTYDMIPEVAVDGQPTLQVATILPYEVADHDPRSYLDATAVIVNMPCHGLAPSYGRPIRSAELTMIGAARQFGLALSLPNLRSALPGVVVGLRRDRPALALETVSGRVVLSFESAEDCSLAARSIRASLALG